MATRLRNIGILILAVAGSLVVLAASFEPAAAERSPDRTGEIIESASNRQPIIHGYQARLCEAATECSTDSAATGVSLVGNASDPEKVSCAKNLPYIYCVGQDSMVFRGFCALAGGDYYAAGEKSLCSGAPSPLGPR